MAYKTLLVTIDETPDSARRLEAALKLAEAHQARLVAVAFAVSAAPMMMTGGYADIAFFESERQRVESVAGAVAEQAKKRLATATLDSEVRIVSCMTGDAARLMALHATYADICILGQPNESAYENERLLTGALLDAPAPVLVWPTARNAPDCGDRILVAWDGRKEASRAARDALPLLKSAETVEVVTITHRFGGERYGEDPGVDFMAWLTRQGVRAELRQLESRSIAETLLNETRDGRFDLLVMGGYGHSRLRESIFGGVTETILDQAPVPVLLAH